MPSDDAILLQPMERARTLYIIGDSFVLPSEGLMFRDPVFGEVFSVRTRFIPGLRGTNFYENENLNPELVETLRSFRIFSPKGAPQYLETDLHSVGNAWHIAQGQYAPFILVMCAQIDLKSFSILDFADKNDFLFPDLPELKPRPGAQIFPFDVVQRHVDSRIASMKEGLRLLKAAGLDQIYLQGIVPPAPEHHYLEFGLPIPAPESTRIKLTRLYNKRLSVLAGELGIGFVDVYDDLADEAGLIREEYSLKDCTHANRRAGLLGLDRMMKLIHRDRERPQFTALRYQMMAGAARPLPPAEGQPASIDYVAIGPGIQIASGAVPPFDSGSPQDGAPSLSADWCRYPSEPNDAVLVRPLSQARTHEFRARAYGGEIFEFASRALLHDYVIYAVREVEITGAAWTPEAEGCVFPPNVFKLLLLPDTEASIATLDRTYRVVAIAKPGGGTMILYDPAQAHVVVHSHDGGTRPFYEAVIGIRHACQPRFVISTALGRWPIDPFYFSTRGLSVSPEEGRNEFALFPGLAAKTSDAD